MLTKIDPATYGRTMITFLNSLAMSNPVELTLIDTVSANPKELLFTLGSLKTRIRAFVYGPGHPDLVSRSAVVVRSLTPWRTLLDPEAIVKGRLYFDTVKDYLPKSEGVREQAECMLAMLCSSQMFLEGASKIPDCTVYLIEPTRPVSTVLASIGDEAVYSHVLRSETTEYAQGVATDDGAFLTGLLNQTTDARVAGPADWRLGPNCSVSDAVEGLLGLLIATHRACEMADRRYSPREAYWRKFPDVNRPPFTF